MTSLRALSYACAYLHCGRAKVRVLAFINCCRAVIKWVVKRGIGGCGLTLWVFAEAASHSCQSAFYLPRSFCTSRCHAPCRIVSCLLPRVSCSVLLALLLLLPPVRVSVSASTLRCAQDSWCELAAWQFC